MKIVPIILILFFTKLAVADEYCKRPEKIDPEFPAGLVGNYEIIGRWPDSDTTYSGHLEIKDGGTSYSLKRTVGGNTIKGEAWIEFCSPDKFMVFKFKYTNAPKAFAGTCYFRGNSDNYYLISCYTRLDKTKYKNHGLEAMFQLQEP